MKSNSPTDWGVLILRVVAGSMLVSLHGWHKLTSWIAYLNGATPWPLAEEVAKLHLPAPVALSFVAMFVEIGCSLCVIAGLFARINALLVSVILGVAVCLNLLSHSDPQLALLYFFMMISVALVGGGKFSVDAKLAGGKSAAAGIMSPELKTCGEALAQPVSQMVDAGPSRNGRVAPSAELPFA